MQKSHLILLVAFLGIATSVAAGDVWINCASGFDIFLDGKPMGVSGQGENGKHLRGIESGVHTIKIEGDGAVLAEFSITVGFDPKQVEFSGLSATNQDEISGASQDEAEQHLVGTVEISSDPGECNVKIGRRRIEKKYTILMIPDLPVSEHKIWFENSGMVLKETVRVQSDKPTEVMVDFSSQRIVIAGDTAEVSGRDVTVEEKSLADADCIEYWIEVLRTDDPEAIEPFQQMLKELGFPREHQTVITIDDDGSMPVYKLRVGPVPRRNKAKWAAGLIRNAGIDTVWILPEECLPPGERPKREFRPNTAGG